MIILLRTAIALRRIAGAAATMPIAERLVQSR